MLISIENAWKTCKFLYKHKLRYEEAILTTRGKLSFSFINKQAIMKTLMHKQ